MENETEEKNEQKTRSIRAAAGTFEALKKIAEEGNFENQGSALTALVSLWEEQNAKRVLPEQGQTIDEVRSHLQALSNIFLSQLDSIANTGNRVRTEFQARLEAQELTLESLHKELEEAREQARACREEAAEARKDSRKLARALEEARANCQRLEALAQEAAQEKEALSATIKALTEVNAGQKAEIEALTGQAARSAELEQQLAALGEAKKLAEQSCAHQLEKAALEREKAVLAEQARGQAALSALQAEFMKRLEVRDPAHFTAST